jgi:transcriptional regulator with XRE-family HTH domain
MRDVYRQWGENIREQREARRWTQAEFAKRLSVTRAAVSYWESGDRAPSDRHKIEIARVFRMSVRGLFPLVVADATEGAVA